MPPYSKLKQSSLKKRSKCLVTMCGVVVALFLVMSASILSPAFSAKYPFHAECQLQWTWSDTNCSTIHQALLDQIQKWKGPENCEQGGEKCLYEVVSDTEKELDATHTTPAKKYIDDIAFKFCGPINSNCQNDQIKVKRAKRSVLIMEKIITQLDKGCAVSGFSKSRVWYAVFDYGTNYCNMRNLADGSGLSSFPDFTEETSDDQCTQFSSADCNTY